jgi:acetylornithine deacetylase/succinyl-diaminopimelate desuccinylase-like protein
LIKATSDDDGKPPILVPTSGGSSPNYAFTQALRVPVINVPIANYDDNQHAADENLRLQNLRNGIELYTQIFARLGTTGW